MFDNSQQDKIIDKDGNEILIPAKSRAEWMRRFGKGKEQNDREFVASDWLSKELFTINNESSVLSYPEAEQMELEAFFYIIRSRNKHNQLLKEKYQELSEKKYGTR